MRKSRGSEEIPCFFIFTRMFYVHLGGVGCRLESHNAYRIERQLLCAEFDKIDLNIPMRCGQLEHVIAFRDIKCLF